MSVWGQLSSKNPRPCTQGGEDRHWECKPLERVFQASVRGRNAGRGSLRPQKRTDAPSSAAKLSSFFSSKNSPSISCRTDDESATIQLDEETLQKAGLLQLRLGCFETPLQLRHAARGH